MCSVDNYLSESLQLYHFFIILSVFYQQLKFPARIIRFQETYTYSTHNIYIDIYILLY